MSISNKDAAASLTEASTSNINAVSTSNIASPSINAARTANNAAGNAQRARRPRRAGSEELVDAAARSRRDDPGDSIAGLYGNGRRHGQGTFQDAATWCLQQVANTVNRQPQGPQRQAPGHFVPGTAVWQEFVSGIAVQLTLSMQ